jgi:PAS domain S-box-containing protein
MIKVSPTRLDNVKWTLTRKGLLLIGVPLLAQLLFLVLYDLLLHQADFLLESQYRSKELFGHYNWLSTLATTSALAGIAYDATGDPDALKVYRLCQNAIPKEVFALSRVVISEPQRQELRKTEGLLKQLSQVLEKTVNAREFEHDRVISVTSAYSEIKPIFSQFLEARRHLFFEERNSVTLDSNSLAEVRTIRRTLLAIFGALDFIGALILLRLYSRQIIEKIAVITKNSLLLEQDKQLSDELGGTDEIADLDRAFHHMADALAAAKSDLKAGEQRMVAMIENMPVALITVSRDNIIDFANPVATILIGKELLGKHIDAVLPQASLTINSESLPKDWRQPQAIEIVNSSGKPLVLEVYARNISTADGQKTLLLMQDVTEKRAVERLKRDFYAMVSHDLRSPLTSIQLTHQLIEDYPDRLPEVIQKSVTDAQRSTKRLLRLVNELLDLEKLETGDLILNLAPTTVSVIVEQSLDAVSSLAESTGVSIEAPRSNAEFVGDQQRLVQVVVNLLSNAIKFSPRGGVVRISHQQHSGFLELRIADQGCGISMEDQAIIFEKFKQAQADDSSRQTGTGLGLSICKAIVEQHKGQIGVESKVGEGSTFWFRIPESP